MEAVVSLKGLDFYSYHGVYDQERKIGGRYRVDISVHYNYTSQLEKENLQASIDYEKIYRVAKDVMATPAQLIETVAERILEKVILLSPHILKVEVTIAKLDPPIGGRCQKAEIRLVSQR